MKKSLYTKRGVTLRGWLKRERTSKKVSMRELGLRLDVPFQFISKVEKGERRLDVVEFVTYCAALDVDPQEGIALIGKP